MAKRAVTTKRKGKPKPSPFPRKLREARETRKLTQIGLARKSGIKPPEIFELEAETLEPKMFHLTKLADALCVSLDYLLDRKGEPLTEVPTKDLLTELKSRFNAYVFICDWRHSLEMGDMGMDYSGTSLAHCYGLAKYAATQFESRLQFSINDMERSRERLG